MVEDLYHYERLSGPSGILTPVGTTVRETLVFIHGSNGDDRQFMELKLLELTEPELLEKMHKKGMQIVLPHAAVNFSLAAFGKEMARVTLTGVSTGGLLALSLFLQDPDRYVAVGAHFPMLLPFSLNDVARVTDYQNRNSITDDEVRVLGVCFSLLYQSNEERDRCDPFRLALQVSVEKLDGKRIYFDVGSDDEYGLFEGAHRLHQVLKSRNVAHCFLELPGVKHEAALILKNWNRLLAHVLS